MYILKNLTLKSEVNCEEAIWCNIGTNNSTLTIGVVYRSPNIEQEEDVKLQKAIREVNKGEYVIMGDCIQWTPLESAGGDQWWECVGFNFVFSKLIS